MGDLTEHPVSAAMFVKTLVGTNDEVYSRLLLISHRFENKTPTEWRETLEGHRDHPTDGTPIGAKREEPKHDETEGS